MNVRELVLLTPALLLALTLNAGCANGSDHGLASYLSISPQHERSQQISATSFYVEELGSSLSSYDMLERAFAAKAETLCRRGVDELIIRRGKRFPHGKLQDIRLETCINGAGTCPKEEATQPLAYGEVQCKP